MDISKVCILGAVLSSCVRVVVLHSYEAMHQSNRNLLVSLVCYLEALSTVLRLLHHHPQHRHQIGERMLNNGPRQFQMWIVWLTSMALCFR